MRIHSNGQPTSRQDVTASAVTAFLKFGEGEGMAVAERKLMLFSIGPVQDFIAQARRTGDLWFGSFLLSRLSRAAAEAFRGKNGIIVYPHIDWEASPDRTRVTNKLLGYIESDSPGQLALDIRIEVARAWKKSPTKRWSGCGLMLMKICGIGKSRTLSSSMRSGFRFLT
ncbi:hypothetical protein HMSSN036_93520 [Paenibacillus macerans]|nr:hypothetical protein HMSSN036_93520 [Paenibacillus macerans]